MLDSHFDKVADLKTTTLLQKRLQHRCFPVNIEKCLRTTFFAEHLQMTASGFFKKIKQTRLHFVKQICYEALHKISKIINKKTQIKYLELNIALRVT